MDRSKICLVATLAAGVLVAGTYLTRRMSRIERQVSTRIQEARTEGIVEGYIEALHDRLL